MAWLPPDRTTRARSLGDWMDRLYDGPETFVAYCTRLKAQSEAGSINYFQIREFLTRARGQRDELIEAIGVSGLQDYAATERGKTPAQVAASFLAMRDAIIATITWTVQNIPEASPYKLVVSLTADGEEVPREFSSPAMAGFRTQLQVIIDAIG